MKKIVWTRHAGEKMRFYRLSENRLKRVLRHPHRIEEGIAPGTAALMQRAGTKKRPVEIWLMYQTSHTRRMLPRGEKAPVSSFEALKKRMEGPSSGGAIKIITAWRYPGESPARNPIPEDILSELRSLL